MNLGFQTAEIYKRIIRLLIDAGVSLEDESEEGETAFHSALVSDNMIVAFEMLALLKDVEQVYRVVTERLYICPLTIAKTHG